jgi:hypothetical protein
VTPRAQRALARAAEGLGAAEFAIARSVVYASLFDYPLTLAQLRQTLIESTQTPSQILATYDRSDALQELVEYRDGFFFPHGRFDLVGERRRREARSRRFLARYRPLLAVISALPYVRLVALSGSIAHLNLEGTGDLDLFIVTRGRRVWSVTVIVLLLAKLLRQRRLLCANFVMSDERLALEQQDLFTASQIVHLKPLVGHDVYRRLLADNPFVKRFYPNFHESHGGPLGFRHGRGFERLRAAIEFVCEWPSAAIEWACRTAYRAHLIRRSASWRSPEQVRLQPDCLKLHTQSHRRSVLERFDRAVRDVLD